MSRSRPRWSSPCSEGAFSSWVGSFSRNRGRDGESSIAGHGRFWESCMGRAVHLSLILVAWIALASTVAAQEPVAPISISGESGSTGRRLAAADQLTADGQAAEAVAEYQRIIEEAGDDL